MISRAQLCINTVHNPIDMIAHTLGLSQCKTPKGASHLAFPRAMAKPLMASNHYDAKKSRNGMSGVYRLLIKVLSIVLCSDWSSSQQRD